ncbi:MAG: hypothetical protein ACYCOR_03220 [Acidobacteriaceae bacterium]
MREVVTRSLQKLVQQEVLAIHGHRIVILDVRALRTLAENHRWLETSASARYLP